MKLVLDEHFSPQIAKQLQRGGHDVVVALALLTGPDRSDAELLRMATEEGRAIVTADVGDFVELHRAAVISGRRHAGIIFTSASRFPRRRRAIGRLVSALETFLAANPDDGALENQTHWLDPVVRQPSAGGGK